MIKHTPLYLRGRIIIRSLLPALFLCGFLLSWLDKMQGPVLPTSSPTFFQQQAIWSRFLGYTPEEHTSQLSCLNQDGKLIITKQTRQLLALDTKSGHTLWKRNLHYALTNPAAIHRTRTFIATAEPRLFALDTHTGDVVWSYKLPHTTLARVAADDKQVIVKTIAGEILSLNARNGRLLWQYKHTHASMMLHTSSAPQLSKDHVLVGFPDGKLLTFDRTRGDLLWDHTVKQADSGSEFDKLVDIAADPIIDTHNAVLYVSAYHGMLQCLSLATGDVKWEKPFSGYMPLALGKHLYAVDDSHTVYAFNTSNGAVVWKQELFKDYQALFYHYRIVGPVLTHKGTQLVIADQASNLYWLDTTSGNIIGSASFRVTSPILSVPLATDDTIYAMNRRSQVAAWKNPVPLPVANE